MVVLFIWTSKLGNIEIADLMTWDNKVTLEFTTDRIRKAINTETGAALTINGTPEIEYYRCVYSTKQRVYKFGPL